jgi:tryptophan-rich sensory protein
MSKPLFRSALVLAGFVLITFCAPLVGMFSQPGAWYVALNKPSWNPPERILGPGVDPALHADGA